MADSVKDLSPAGPLRDSRRDRWRAAWPRLSPAGRSGGRLRPAARRLRPTAGQRSRSAWLPVWSVPAAMRAVRATLVMPGMFALTSVVIGDPQMTLFAVFGSFATLVLVTFGGTRRDKALAHLGLAVTGSAALIIGTLVSGTPWLAALVTIPVTFAIFFAGVAGPNAAAGVLGALLAYILPVASSAAASAIPSRLAGWWLASAAYPEGVACAGTTPAYYRPDMLWVGEHLHHLAERGQAITGPAAKVAELRQLPWWR
jgi:hypothetical protein